MYMNTNIYITKYIFVFYISCQQLVEGFLYTLWAQGWGMYILKYKFVLDINCQMFGNMIQ